MNIKSLKEAKETKVFVLNHKGEIEETTLFDHVMASADKTTSPRGIMTRIFVEEAPEACVPKWNAERRHYEDFGCWAVKAWEIGRNTPKIVASHPSQEAAENDWFTRIYEFDFLPDDQRATEYFLTRPGIEKYASELFGS